MNRILAGALGLACAFGWSGQLAEAQFPKGLKDRLKKPAAAPAAAVPDAGPPVADVYPAAVPLHKPNGQDVPPKGVVWEIPAGTGFYLTKDPEAQLRLVRLYRCDGLEQPRHELPGAAVCRV
jgi:hypothetical protein